MQQEEIEKLAEERRFTFALHDYDRLATQEQAIMDSRLQIWIIFFTAIVGPTGYAELVGLRVSVFVLALIPFFITCLSLHVKHANMVLRKDIRKSMKDIAARWGYSNHDANFKKELQEEQGRWWAGWYNIAMGAAFVVVEVVLTCFTYWYFYTNVNPFLSFGMGMADLLLIAITMFCTMIRLS